MKQLLLVLAASLGIQYVSAQSWDISGNSGITTSHFLGTVNDASLIFKTYNTERMRLTNTGNLLIGTATDATYKLDINGNFRSSGDGKVNGMILGKGGGNVALNTALGYNALLSNTTGNYLTAIGYSALLNNTTGVINTAIGYATLMANTTGNYNTAIGGNSLQVNTTGYGNTAIGYQSLSKNQNADNNSAVGYASLTNNTTGMSNSSFGRSALAYNTTGANNNAFGMGALQNNTTGAYNIAIGNYSLRDNNGNSNISLGENSQVVRTVGANNITIGVNTLRLATDASFNTIVGGSAGYNTMGSGNVFLGYGVAYYETGSNKLYIDNSSTTTPLIYGDFATNTLNFNGTVGIGTSHTSEAGYKLFVETGIRTRKVKVDQATWADYVFQDDYRLPTLAEVEKYISKYKHLPDVPSAEEVEANGIDLGDNQAVLLRKIEELTLYMIELNKKVEKLEEENKQLKSGR